MSFLFVDQILHSIPGQLIHGIKHVTWDDRYLIQTDEHETIFIPSLLGETLGQLAAWNVMDFHQFSLRPVAGIVASTSLYRHVHPGETIFLESVIDELDNAAVRYHSIATVNGEKVFTIDGAIGPLLPMQQFIDEAVVRQQFAEIYRPSVLQSPPVAEINGIHTDLHHQKTPSGWHPSCIMAFDRVVEIEPQRYWIAHKLVSRAAGYFADHFPLNPVLPMTVLLQCKLQVTEDFVTSMQLSQKYQVTQLRKIKMNDFVHPGDSVTTHIKLKSHTDSLLVISCLSEVNGKRVCVVEVVFESTHPNSAESI